MATSEARVIANRQNSLKSTGPKTPEGKDRSRANALKHGLCSTVLVPESLELIRLRANEWYYCLKPQNPHQSWYVDEIALASIRIDRCERIERRLRDREMLRAELVWDDDRMIEVEALGSKLSRRPSEVRRQLRATPQGCDWLRERWAFLAQAADADRPWTADQTRLAFDMLGTSIEAREGREPGDIVDLDGKMVEPSGGPAALAHRELDDLKDRRDVVADLDEVDRALVSTDQLDSTNAELKKLRRYENTLHSRLKWFTKEMHDPSPHVKTHVDLKPNWVTTVEPVVVEEIAASEPVVEAETPPPADPDLVAEHEILEITSARREEKIRKAETRRESKRRRTERRRA